MQHQSALASYCRSGQFESIPGVAPERAAVYRRLIFNAFDSTLRKAYPLTVEALGEEGWKQLLDTFMESHDCRSPHLWSMPIELYEFVRDGNYPGAPAYLADLLYFEWVEIEVHMMVDTPVCYQESGDPLTDRLILNPDYRLCRFTYPVFKTSPSQLPSAQEGLYFVFIYRHPETLEVEFIELPPIYTLVIELLAKEPLSGGEAFQAASEALGLELESEYSRNFYGDLLQRKGILGFKGDDL